MKNNFDPNNENLTYLESHNVLEDPDFSPERNQSIINGTIAKYEKNREEKMKMWNEPMRNRAEMVASFLKHCNYGKGTKDVEKYFGHKEMAKLRGEEIVNMLKGQTSLFKAMKAKHDKTLA